MKFSVLKTDNISEDIFIKMIITYVAILIIPLLLLGVFVFNYFTNTMKSEIMGSELKKIEHVNSISDMYITAMRYIGTSVVSNQNMKSYIFDSNFEKLHPMDFRVIADELKGYKATNSFVDNVYIYYRNADVVMSSDGKYTKKIFYDYVLNSKEDTRTELDDLFLNAKSFSLLKEQSFGGEDVFVSILPSRTNEIDSNVTVIVTIKSEVFHKLLIDLLPDNNGGILVINSQNEIARVIGEERFTDILFENRADLFKPSEAKTQIAEKKLNGKSYIAFSIKSVGNEVCYLGIIPYETAFIQIAWIRAITIVVVVMCLLLGLVLAYFFARKNKQQIGKIVGVLGNIKPDSSSSGFEALHTAVSNMSRENKTLERSMKEQYPLIKMNILNKLISGSYIDEESLAKSLRQIEAEPIKGFFCVMVVGIDGFTDIIENTSELTDGLSRFAIINVISELFSEISKAHVIDNNNGEIIFILESLPPNSLSQIAAAAVKAREFFENNFDFTITIGIGEIYKNIMELPKSYMEAAAALGYRMVKGKNSIIAYNSIENQPDEELVYTIAARKKILSCLKRGDFDGINEIFLEILKEINERSLNVNTVKCVYFDIINTAIHSLTELKIEDFNMVVLDENFISDMMSCDTMFELYEKTLLFYRHICNNIRNNKERVVSDLTEQILQFINTNISNPDLSLNYVADKFSVSPTYMSRFIKNEFKQSFVEYMHKMRIAKVKELLKENDEMSLEEIASLTGYLDSHSIIRVFKKYVGVTPGAFRKDSLNK